MTAGKSQAVRPEMNLSIVSLGLIYEVKIDEAANSLHIEMTLTSPGCPMLNDFLILVDTALNVLRPHGLLSEPLAALARFAVARDR